MLCGKFDATDQKHYQNLGSDASSVWNFCACFLDIIILVGKLEVALPSVGCFVRLPQFSFTLVQANRQTIAVDS